jgi:hypothetical protein
MVRFDVAGDQQIIKCLISHSSHAKFLQTPLVFLDELRDHAFVLQFWGQDFPGEVSNSRCGLSYGVLPSTRPHELHPDCRVAGRAESGKNAAIDEHAI